MLSTSKSEGPGAAGAHDTRILTAAEAPEAGLLLRQGHLVVIPTETVYGLAAAAVDPDAVAAIFDAKGRPQDNPLIVHLASRDDLLQAVPSRLAAARAAVEAFAPGPLTVVVPAPAWVPPAVRAGLPTVALRVPAHPVAQAVISAAGVPVAAPSANRSGRPSPTTCAMARSEMSGRVAAIVDGGDADIGIESTVVDGTAPRRLSILRPGHITAAALSAATGVPVDDAPASSAGRSPGTRYAHYRPEMPVYAFAAPGRGDVLAAVAGRQDARVLLGPAAPDGAGRTDPVDNATAGSATADDAGADDHADVAGTRVRGMSSWEEFGRRLFREFWAAERDGIACLYVEMPPPGVAPGLADRIMRAAVR